MVLKLNTSQGFLAIRRPELNVKFSACPLQVCHYQLQSIFSVRYHIDDGGQNSGGHQTGHWFGPYFCQPVLLDWKMKTSHSFSYPKKKKKKKTSHSFAQCGVKFTFVLPNFGNLGFYNGQNTEAIRSSISDLNRFGKVVKLTPFHPFEFAVDTLNQCNSVSEG